MKLKKNLVLVGMMGSGKSSIGKILSKKLEFEFIDTDNKIEEIEKKTISEIFNNNGEKYFRNIEEVVSLKSLQLNNKVIALGGGAFMNKNIRNLILKNSLTFWLDLNLKTVNERVKWNKKRPLLNHQNTEEIIKKLYSERKNIYKLAKYKINCDKLDKKQIVEKIIKLYENS